MARSKVGALPCAVAARPAERRLVHGSGSSILCAGYNRSRKSIISLVSACVRLPLQDFLHAGETLCIAVSKTGEEERVVLPEAHTLTELPLVGNRSVLSQCNTAYAAVLVSGTDTLACCAVQN